MTNSSSSHHDIDLDGVSDETLSQASGGYEFSFLDHAKEMTMGLIPGKTNIFKTIFKNAPNAVEAIKNGDGWAETYDALMFPNTYAQGKLDDAEAKARAAESNLADSVEKYRQG